MTRPPPDIERLAEQRLAADEERITGPRRTNVPLGRAWRSFWRAPSPWMISSFLLLAVAGRGLVGDGSWWDSRSRPRWSCCSR
jgi:hypothetical protein